MNFEPKQAEQVISLDIGSTFTKAALFEIGDDCFSLTDAARVPTTTDSLFDAVRQVISQLNCLDTKTERPLYPVCFSSSAKGGLHVIAVGIVPELTLKVAKLTALSAGAKVSRSFGYKLTSQDVQEIDMLNPDIILLSGGTDGGNESYLRHNAGLLRSLTIRPQIIYAGNHVLADEITEVLTDFPLHVAENVLPTLDEPNFEPARQRICRVFLDSIVSGKGLDEVVRQLGCSPLPTPLAVMELVQAMSSHGCGWEKFCLVDMGGATTDIYSCCPNDLTDGNVIYRGVPEPSLKRTVEGDLGIRTSASSVMIAGSPFLQAAKSTEEVLAMMDYVNKITQKTGYLPRSEQERSYDRTLAEICLTQGIKRHVGTRKRVFTEQGEKYLQTGKDLRAVKKMILTGGFLCRLEDKTVLDASMNRLRLLNDTGGETSYLLPEEMTYYRDSDYLFPLLGNLVRRYPRQAAQTAVNHLVSLQSTGHLATESTC